MTDESLGKEAGRESPGRDFRTTHWSVVAQAGRTDSEASAWALEVLCRSYWPPLYAYLRRRGFDSHQAEDLTQEFFRRLLAGNFLATADHTRGRFRTFLLTAMNHFVANEWDRSQARKRGGGYEFVSLDHAAEDAAVAAESTAELTPERVYERRWAEAVLARVLDRLRAEFDGGTVKRFDILKPFLTEEKGATSYAEAAGVLGLSEPAVKSAIHRLRQRWRELMRDEIAHTLNPATREEVDAEIRYLIDVLG